MVSLERLRCCLDLFHVMDTHVESLHTVIGTSDARFDRQPFLLF